MIDLHNVLRSWVITFLYSLKGVRFTRIKKGRAEKRAFIRTKKTGHLPHTTDRYRDVFLRAGIDVPELILPAFNLDKDAKAAAEIVINENISATGQLAIAIAPFAKHRTKSWGSARIISLMQLINERKTSVFFLFGGREDVHALQEIMRSIPGSVIIAGKYKLEVELALLSRLDLMVSMDSSNMHLASLSDIPTVSIWGGTHPRAGFSPLGQNTDLMVQVPMKEMDCRPCSVYGKSECIRKDVEYKCMEDITPESVLSIIRSGTDLFDQI